MFRKKKPKFVRPVELSIRSWIKIESEARGGPPLHVLVIIVRHHQDFYSLQPVSGRVVRRYNRCRIPVQVHLWRHWDRLMLSVDGFLVRGRVRRHCARVSVVHVGPVRRIVVHRGRRSRTLMFGELMTTGLDDRRRRCRVRARRTVFHRHVCGRRRAAVIRVMTGAVTAAGHGYRHHWSRRWTADRSQGRRRHGRHSAAGRFYLACGDERMKLYY